MADLFASGFETGDLTEFTGSNNSPAVGSSPIHCGGYACDFDADSEYVYVDTAAQTECYCRIYVRLDDLPPTDQSYYARIIHFLGNSGTDPICRVYFNYTTGSGVYNIRLNRFYPSNQSTYYTFTWAVDTWYCLEMYFKKHASTGEFKVWLDGSLIISDTGLDTSGSYDLDQVRVGTDFLTAGWGLTVSVDCIVIANTGDIGTHDNSELFSFETGDFSQWDATEGSPSVQELRKHCGEYACECDIGQYGVKGPYRDMGQHKDIFCQLEVQFDSLPASGESVEFARFMRDSTSLLKLKIENDSGTIKWGFIYLAAGSETEVLSTTSTNPSADTWYCVKVQIRCSHIDGQTVGIYKMWVDGTALSDIDQTSKDTDYTQLNIIKMRTYTDMAGGVEVFYDCIEWSTTTMSCHAAGSEDVESLEESADCIPVTTGKPLEVFQNCVPLQLQSAIVNEQMRGTANLTLPYGISVVRGDLFHVIVEGKKLLQGRAVGVNKQRKKGIKIVTCQNKTARLYGRYILNSSHRIYAGYDAGAIASDLVEYYFYGLFDTDNINTNTGTTITEIDLYEKTVGDALEELAKRAGAYFYVDDDNSVHFFVEGEEKTGYVIKEKDLIDIQVSDLGEALSKVIIKGFGVSAESGSGIPERLHSERRITTEAEAQEVADKYKDIYEAQVTGMFPVHGFYCVRHGQTVVIDSIKDGYDYETVVVTSATYYLQPGKWRTDLKIGRIQPTFQFALAQIQKELEEAQVNRISTHQGTDTADTDPFLIYDQLLNLALGSEVNVLTSAVTLRTGTCSSSSEPSECADIYVAIQLGPTAGSGNFALWVEDGSGHVYDTRIVGLDASWQWGTFRMRVRDDISGKTLYVKAHGFTGCNVYVRASLEVLQFDQHSHSVSQAQTHDMD